MTEQHWAVLAIEDISSALPVKKFWVARQHLNDAKHAIRAVHNEARQTSRSVNGHEPKDDPARL